MTDEALRRFWARREDALQVGIAKRNNIRYPEKRIPGISGYDVLLRLDGCYGDALQAEAIAAQYRQELTDLDLLRVKPVILRDYSKVSDRWGGVG